ncbi:MAG: hypothetical protein L6R41_003324 [Letrouitia leprolyta]|nr:MAG: hypothetical protein L6R41_003324 [Letrouitia leprolyta]
MIDDSRPPFKYIHFFTRPSSLPRAVFNPLKGGITLVWVLRRCFLSEFWPGSIKAVVWDLSLKGTPTSVAFLEIKNVPNSLSLPSSNPNTTDDNTLGEPSMVVNTTAPLQSANNVSLQLLPSDASFRIPPHVEKRWLACWSQLFLHVMQFSPERYVKDGVDPTPDPQKTSVFHYSCDVMSFMPTRDKINLELLPTFGRVIRPYMTYGEVAGALLAWITRVADTPDGWRRPQSVFDGNMFVEEGSLSITLSAT